MRGLKMNGQRPTVMSRRRCLQTGVAFLSGWIWRQRWQQVLAASQSPHVKRCVVLWMAGGPSQFETIDPKPGTGTGGPTRAIPTSVPGIHIAEHLPQLAQRLHHLNLIRGLSSPEGDHERGEHLLHTGFPRIPAFPRPAFGSIVSFEHGESDLPRYVTLAAPSWGPAYLGAQHAPFAFDDPEQARQQLLQLRRREQVLARLAAFDRWQEDRLHDENWTHRRHTLERLQRLAGTAFARALDLQQVPADLRRYGDTPFGRRCLTVRRLLEVGVSFIEVGLPGWDTHNDNFSAVANLCAELDPAMSALLDDLRSGGLWQETLVVWLGEFGRTPIINGNNGRDHFPQVTPVMLGGAGLKAGGVVGRTNPHGTEIVDQRITVADLLATCLQAIGIDPQQEYRNEFGAVAPLTDHGQPVAALF